MNSDRTQMADPTPTLEPDPEGQSQALPVNQSNAARRAIAEAEQRRLEILNLNNHPQEIDGRGGLDPIRYGDWEVNGLTSDF